jgi:hypothetical protein
MLVSRCSAPLGSQRPQHEHRDALRTQGPYQHSSTWPAGSFPNKPSISSKARPLVCGAFVRRNINKQQLGNTHLREPEPQIYAVHNSQPHKHQVIFPSNSSASCGGKLKPQNIGEHQRRDRNPRTLRSKMGWKIFRGDGPTVDIYETSIARTKSALS